MLISEGHEFQVDRTGYAKALEWQLAWYMQRTPRRLAGAGWSKTEIGAEVKDVVGLYHVGSCATVKNLILTLHDVGNHEDFE